LGGAVVPAVSEAAPVGLLQLVRWSAVLVAAVACTVFVVRHHLRTSDGDSSDLLFWDLFGGAVVIAPALLIPAVASPPAGLALAAVAGVSGIAAYRSSPAVLSWHDARRRRRVDGPRCRAAAVVHEEIVGRWARYELDPALAISYPDLADVRRPETAAFVKALREAETLKTLADPGYPYAVERLGQALDCAETAAGVPATLRSAPRPAPGEREDRGTPGRP
jgi:phage tail protein X